MEQTEGRGRNKEGGKWDWTKEFEKVLQDGQENNWRVDVAHLSDEKIRSSRRQIPRRFRTQYSANHKIVADLTCRSKYGEGDQMGITKFDFPLDAGLAGIVSARSFLVGSPHSSNQNILD